MTNRRDVVLAVPPTWVVEGPVAASTGYGLVVRARATVAGSLLTDHAGISGWGETEEAAWDKLLAAVRAPRPPTIWRAPAGAWDSYKEWRADDSLGGARALAAGVQDDVLRAAYEAARAVLPPGWWVSDLTDRYHVVGQSPGVWYASATAPYLRLGDDSELAARGAWGPDPLSALRALLAHFV